jgi:SRSO17 transposase
MNRTFTPRLGPAVLERLEAYADRFRPHFNHPRQGLWNEVYLRGLIQEGERKSIEPLSRRVSLPAKLAAVADPEQALQQFMSQSGWDETAVAREYRAAMAEALAAPDGVFVVDDTAFPKQGRHSVGVQRQHCGPLGKKANCQCAVSLHYVAPQGHCPLSMRLYLPAPWLADPARLDRAGVPPEERRELTKGQIALELLDQARAEGWPGRIVVADAGYGVSGPFRRELEARGLFYVAGVTEQMVVFAEEPPWEWPQEAPRGAHRPRSRPRLATGAPEPVPPGRNRAHPGAAEALTPAGHPLRTPRGRSRSLPADQLHPDLLELRSPHRVLLATLKCKRQRGPIQLRSVRYEAHPQPGVPQQHFLRCMGAEHRAYPHEHR